MLATAEKDRKFAAIVSQAANHVLKEKKKFKHLKFTAKSPTQKSIDKLRRKLWEFSEELRLDAVAMRKQEP